MDIDFDCTLCGKCCQNLKLPMTVAEAIAWLSDGNDVQVLCEAIPWPADPPAANLQAAYKRQRTFPVMSGSMPTQILVTLVGSFKGACPNLLADKRCGIYERRPMVCRIYPAEVRPFATLQPESKACPPEAWAPGRTPFMRQGTLVDEHVHALIQASRQAAVTDVPMKERLCRSLRLDTAAMSNEGFVIHSPDRAALLSELTRQAATGDGPEPEPIPWRFASNRQSSVEALTGIGAECIWAGKDANVPFEYVGYHADDASRGAGTAGSG